MSRPQGRPRRIAGRLPLKGAFENPLRPAWGLSRLDAATSKANPELNWNKISERDRSERIMDRTHPPENHGELLSSPDHPATSDARTCNTVAVYM